MTAKDEKRPNDTWISTCCGQCYCMCGIKVRVQDGVVTEVAGNPAAPTGRGRICVKGLAAPHLLYDPYRVNYPLKRTNPEKGLGVDPKWERISWDEALEIICEKLKRCHEKEPRGLFFQATTTQASEIRFGVIGFMKAFGTPNYWVSGGGLHCGNGAHFMNGIMHVSWSIIPDFAHCNYALNFGCSKGHGAGHVAVQNATQVADARYRGFKNVVFDPFQSAQASKAHEWIPIRVGTDGAMALGLVNVLVNELGIYDREYLMYKTNGPYLIRPSDGRYMRDEATKKPLVWDVVERCAKVHDDPSVTRVEYEDQAHEVALQGTYEVRGVQCHPAFELLKEHVKKYTPEKVAKITWVPAATIRRVAKELGEAAEIGSTVTIKTDKGLKKIPKRPVATHFFRGAQGHVNSGWTCLSIDMVNHIVGAADTWGAAFGLGGTVMNGYEKTGKPYQIPYPCPDGLLVAKAWVYDHVPYPMRVPKQPTRLDLHDMFPTSIYNAFVPCSPRWFEMLERFKIPPTYRPDVMVNFGSNSVMTMGNAEQVTENFLKKFGFGFYFQLYITEFEEAVADIVLPDCCYLERYSPAVSFPSTFSHPQGEGEWGWTIRQPVVEPLPERRDFNEVMLEISERLGILPKFYKGLNDSITMRYGGKMSDKYRLCEDGSVKHTWEDVTDRLLKDRFGEEHGLEHVRKTAVFTWPKRPEDVYWKWFNPSRVPIYFEYFIDSGEQISKLWKEHEGDDFFKIDWARFKALADWYPCPSHDDKETECDMYAFYWRAVTHCNSLTQQNPYLDEVSQDDPYIYAVQINRATAEDKGIKDGDFVWLENPQGHKVKGWVALTDGIEPKHLAIAAVAGHWGKYMPIAKGKGTFFNDLVEIDLDHTDPLTFNQDICCRVKIYKAEEQG
ncbi:MAG: molybdopterin-dependent oxidoreductase [Deltaproteobacteria bacterium]|nr:molybdopterin-dependent oxidoreductase [Deltaproteobacteria bacterium]